MLTANIILPFPLNDTYTYYVPQAMEDNICVGQRVIVSFGAKRFFTGIVYSLGEASNVADLKPIAEIIDNKPIVSQNQLLYWRRLADYYICSLGDIMRLALPSALRLQSDTTVIINEEITPDNLSDKESFVYSILQNENGLKINDLAKQCDFRPLPVLRTLFERNIVHFDETITERYREKTIDIVTPNFDIYDTELIDKTIATIRRAKKQIELLERIIALSLEYSDGIPKNKLKADDSYSESAFKSLVDKQLITIEHRVVSRVLFDKSSEQPKTLTMKQQQTVEAVEKVFAERRTALLFGVTSSGKTEIYIDLILKELEKGKSVLYLVPEIGLTTQLVSRLKGIIGDKLLVYHSRMNDSERVEVWNEVSATDCRVVIGARSALFLPFRHLGLIVVDEEHDTSYRQTDTMPHYTAKSATAFLAQIFDAKILLGSATPSIETYAMASVGRIGLVRLDERYGEIRMPDIELIDLREMYHKKRMRGHFSLELIDAINATLSEGQQVILFQNRRGYSLTLECRDCGFVAKCNRCDVSLTYHKHIGALKCHYCGFLVYDSAKVCRRCGSHAVHYSGFGTEQVETEAQELFPEARVGRLDFDTTRRRRSFEDIIRRFETQNLDIMVGTQMIAKGLDFSNVGLVAVLNADNLLNFTDFRVEENAFQTLVQISGRAGRRQAGRVMIQTYSPDSELMKCVAANDFERFFTIQMQERHIFRYPPYCRMTTLTLKHRDNNLLTRASDYLADSLRNNEIFEVLGAESPPISKINNTFIRNIIIKTDAKYPLVKVNPVIVKHIEAFKRNTEYKQVGVFVDVE
ncbi:MAG: primosomal protein N' [Bacteroidetes bacterium]|nr:MAG: primosomal protein N' [Bacteroidota bacterium]